MGDFVRVADAAQIGEASMGAFEVGGERIAVANVGGSFHAFGNTCTHRQFDVTTGAVLRGPAVEPVRSYATRVEDDALHVAV